MIGNEGSWKDGLFFYERVGGRLEARLKLPAECSVYARNECRECGFVGLMQFVELDGHRSPIRFWVCHRCGKAIRANRRPKNLDRDAC